MNRQMTEAYIRALTGHPDSIIDFRCIHDTKKDIPAHHFRGTLEQYYQTLCSYNNDGYGIFCNINALDGNGRELANVAYIRAHVIDLDNLITAQQNFERAIQWQPLPSFGVQTSPGKYHVYWVMQPYKDNDFYTIHQRKLRQFFDGDKSVIDATRVLRVPGFYHRKKEPYLVQCFSLAGFGNSIAPVEMMNALVHVNIIDAGGARFPLGEPSLAAPDLDWLKKALSLVDPNKLDRSEWISLTAAIKQAGWTLTTSEDLFKIWSEWCAKYEKDDLGENLKQWESLRETEVGWPYIVNRTPIKAYKMGFENPKEITTTEPIDAATVLNKKVKSPDEFDYIINAVDCPEYFKNCYFVVECGEIFTSDARFMNSTQFNGKYGGKLFTINNSGKTTDEAWKAALRSTEWTIPKVDHTRFLPDLKTFEIIEDELGRKGLNTYIPVKIIAKQGDVSLWLNHISKMLPDQNDQKIIYDYLAHIVKYPGYKIPWAPLIQSTEGVGKTVIQEAMTKILGSMYTYLPKADQLTKSGNTFNAWIRNKLLIMVNEVKVDEKRELVEILKPLISDARIEVQRKGVDQEMEDNIANWFFFSNFRDAIPISKNGRRWAIFYSQIQTANDMILHGMDDEYFNRLWSWLRDGGGHQAIAYWLLNRPIEKGQISQRAPRTSSYDEAINLSRSPIECVIEDCIQDGISGFRGGYISVLACIARAKAANVRNPTQRVIETVLEQMGYIKLGKAPRPYAQEDFVSTALLFGSTSNLNVEDFGRVQGYE